MAGKVSKCLGCGKRYRKQTDWTPETIAGLEIGMRCPDCGSGGSLNANLGRLFGLADAATIDATDPDAPAEVLIHDLLRSYPTPREMREKADQLAKARKDLQARNTVSLMRQLADDLETA